MTRIKNKIFLLRAAIVSFFLLLGSRVLAITQEECGEEYDVVAGVCVPNNTGLPGGTVISILSNALSWITGIFGFIAVIAFAVSGILYLTATGNEDQIKKAKTAMKWSIIGVVVGMSGLVIIYAISKILEAQNVAI